MDGLHQPSENTSLGHRLLRTCCVQQVSAACLLRGHRQKWYAHPPCPKLPLRNWMQWQKCVWTWWAQRSSMQPTHSLQEAENSRKEEAWAEAQLLAGWSERGPFSREPGQEGRQEPPWGAGHVAGLLQCRQSGSRVPCVILGALADTAEEHWIMNGVTIRSFPGRSGLGAGWICAWARAFLDTGSWIWEMSVK